MGFIDVTKLLENMGSPPDPTKPETRFVIDAVERAMNLIHMLNLYLSEGQEVKRASRDSRFSGFSGSLVNDCDQTVWDGCEMLGISRLYTVSMQTDRTKPFVEYRSTVTLERAYHAASDLMFTEKEDRRKAAGKSEVITLSDLEDLVRPDPIHEDQSWRFSGFSAPSLWWQYHQDGITLKITMHKVFRPDIPAKTLDDAEVRQRFDRATRRAAGLARAARTRANRAAANL